VNACSLRIPRMLFQSSRSRSRFDLIILESSLTMTRALLFATKLRGGRPGVGRSGKRCVVGSVRTHSPTEHDDCAPLHERVHGGCNSTCASCIKMTVVRCFSRRLRLLQSTCACRLFSIFRPHCKHPPPTTRRSCSCNYVIK